MNEANGLKEMRSYLIHPGKLVLRHALQEPEQGFQMTKNVVADGVANGTSVILCNAISIAPMGEPRKPGKKGGGGIPRAKLGETG